MKYKELHSVSYDSPNWDEITNAFVEEWTDKIKNGSWCFYDEDNLELNVRKNKYEAKIRELKYKNSKFDFLVKWEIKNKEIKSTISPLYNLCRQYFKQDSYSSKIHILADYMFDKYCDNCKESFIDVNMPVLYNDDDESYHRKELSGVFESSKTMKTESKDRFDEMLRSYFLFSDLCLMVKYKTPDKNELTLNLTGKFDSLITDGDWKVKGKGNKLQVPKSKVDFIKQFNDGDCALNHIYINSKRAVNDEIQIETKKNYRAGFIYLNMSAEIKGTMFEDDSIIKLGKLFDEYYDYLAEQFCNDIVNMYKKLDILELFEKAESKNKMIMEEFKDD